MINNFKTIILIVNLIFGLIFLGWLFHYLNRDILKDMRVERLNRNLEIQQLKINQLQDKLIIATKKVNKLESDSAIAEWQILQHKRYCQEIKEFR